MGRRNLVGAVSTLWGGWNWFTPHLLSGWPEVLLSSYPGRAAEPALHPESWGFSFCTCPQGSFITCSQSLPLRSPWP